MDRIQLEAMANDYLQKAMQLRRNGCFIEGREYFAMSHAMNCYLGRGNFIDICRRFLELECTSDSEVQDYINWAHAKFDFVLSLPALVRKSLDQEQER